MDNLMVGRWRLLAVTSVLMVCAASAQAQTQAIDAAGVLGLLKQAMTPAVNVLTAKAISWLGAFATLQFFITNYSLLKSDASLEAGIGKFIGAVAWVGVVLLLINYAPQFIGGVGDQFFTLIGFDLPSPGAIIGHTIGGASAAAALAVGVGAIPFVGNTAGMLLVYIALGILAVGMYFAFKIFMLQLELALIVMLSPLSFALLGLNTLRDQGIAPFKALLSLGYRILLLTVILSAFGEVSESLKASIASTDKESLATGFGMAVGKVLSAMGAYLLLCYLVFKSDSIAATLSSGATSMGTGDVAQAVAAGAAMGAAVASGGAVAAGAASSAPQSMREFMASLGGGTVSNASSMGSAIEPSPLPASTPSASMSMSGYPSSPLRDASSSHPGFSGEGDEGLKGGETFAQAELFSTQSAGTQPQGGAPSTSSKFEGVASSRIGPDLSGSGGNWRMPSQASNASRTESVRPLAAPSQASTGTPSAVSSGKGRGPTPEAPTVLGRQAQSNGPLSRGAGSPVVPGADVATGRIGPDMSGTDQPPVAPTQESPAPQAGSGRTAAISGSQGELAENLGKLVDHLSSQAAPRKPRLRDQLAEANRHMEKESSGVSVHINSHNTD